MIYIGSRITRINSNKMPEIIYKKESLLQTYQPDYVCFDKIILELKAVSKLIDEHRAQLFKLPPRSWI